MRQPSSPSADPPWAEQTFGHATLGDLRRTRRLVQIATDLVRTPGASLVQASIDDAAVEGAYRFVRNPHVDPLQIAEAGYAATAVRAAPYQTLVEIQDTTTLSYRHQVAPDLGDVGGEADSTQRGILAHSSLLVDPQTEQTVGLLNQHRWMRSSADRGQSSRRGQRAYPDKESFKWQQTGEQNRERLGPELSSRLISVSDRESDVYQYLADKVAHAERFVVRVRGDRLVHTEQDPIAHFLGEVAREQAPIVGTLLMEVPQRGGRPARVADLTVRAMPICLRRPARLMGCYPATLQVNLVVAREESPAVQAEPLEWILVTTEPIKTPEQVLQVLEYYRMRWKIEEFHRVWKSGVGVERLRQQTPENLLRLALILAFAAVRLMQLRESMQSMPQAPCEAVLKPLEWKVLWAVVEKKPAPKRVPSVQWAYYALARLAGWTDSKRTGRVGYETLWRGWFKLQERMEGYLAASLV
jgi:Transposase DNA-binding/Transposase Tn5 dimerisation domain